MKGGSVRYLCFLLGCAFFISLVCAESSEVAARQKQESSAFSASSAKTTRAYELLQLSSADVSRLQQPITPRQFMSWTRFLFQYEDANPRADGFGAGLPSFAPGATAVSVGDGFQLAHRLAGCQWALSAENEYESRCGIPLNKAICCWEAIWILEGARRQRAADFESFTAGEPPPVEDLTDFSKEKQESKLSLDGRYEAYLQDWKGVYNLYVKDRVTGRVRRVSSFVDSDIADFFWGEGNCLFFLKDSAYNECNHVFLAGFGCKEKDLTPVPGVDFGFVGDQKSGGRHYIITVHYNNAKRRYLYEKRDIVTREAKPIDRHQCLPVDGDCIAAEYFDIPGDDSHKIKITEEFNFGESAKIYEVNAKNEAEKLIYKVPEGRHFVVQSFSNDGSVIYALSDAVTPYSCPVALSLRSGELRVLFSDPEQYDVLPQEGAFGVGEQPLCDFDTGTPLVVQYYARKFSAFGLNKKVANALEAVKKELGEGIKVVEISPDLNEYKIQRVVPMGSGNTYLYKHSTGVLELLQENEYEEPESVLDTWVRPISFLNRSGAKIEGYLSLPIGKAPENLPTVMLLHGGPWARDVWQVSSDVNVLVANGYAVLQLNYGGSTGYGCAFLNAADCQWEKPRYDIEDATKWLIKKGIADPGRICIFGHSFGGYAALCGVTFTNLFSCAISVCGFADVEAFLLHSPGCWKDSGSLFRHVGTDIAQLQAISPSEHLRSIKAPLFIAQGANDHRIKAEDTDKFVNALRANGKIVHYMRRENEGHGFQRKENVLAFWTLALAFLKRYMPSG
ncbi:MAG: prolyl oligopeptidase family serine peptidase [Oscillospiraceae bacterium]|jgi:dipeptidyl aminopeptidase/acylaminoacyl peptidase|nr:prolyl oligopeptidase family serine peptidase [Oscillospiraceae bacterium]